MKVFISWSGDLSREIAEIFRKWIPRVIQAAKPFMSSEDIEKGARWANDLPKELDSTNVGISIVTGDNFDHPWLLFEAGALSKSMGARVCPILFGIEAVSDITGPLTQFQAAKKFTLKEVRAVIEMMNGQLSEPLSKEVLDEAFNANWPKLERDVGEVLDRPRKDSQQPARREDREVIDEILEHVRLLSQSQTQQFKRYSLRALSDRSLADLNAMWLTPTGEPSKPFGIVEPVARREYRPGATAEIYRDPVSSQKAATVLIDGTIEQLPYRHKLAQAKDDADLLAVKKIGMVAADAPAWFDPREPIE